MAAGGERATRCPPTRRVRSEPPPKPRSGPEQKARVLSRWRRSSSANTALKGEASFSHNFRDKSAAGAALISSVF